MRNIASFSVVLLAGTSAAWAADLTKVERTIRHEPAYLSNAPKYCLLVFGPKAETKVWLVVDGKSLYVDEMGKGDLTKAKRVPLSEFGAWFKAVGIQVADNQTKYISAEDWMYDTQEHWLRISFTNSAGWRYTATPGLADQPHKAPVVHFGGPLTLSLGYRAPKSLKPGDTVKLAPRLGTPGLGEEVFTSIQTIPGIDELNPQADIEFPPQRRPGAPIKTRVDFSWCECCGGLNPYRLQVPPEAGQGNAKITLSFPAWKGGKVAPATFEIPMDDAPVTAK